MRTTIVLLLTLASGLAASAQTRAYVQSDTNGVLLASSTNLFTANSNLLNASVGGVNTNLSGLALASGIATLDHGTALVNTVWAYTTNHFLVSYVSQDGGLSLCGARQVTNGVSFVLFSANPDDTNQVHYSIVKP